MPRISIEYGGAFIHCTAPQLRGVLDTIGMGGVSPPRRSAAWVLPWFPLGVPPARGPAAFLLCGPALAGRCCRRPLALLLAKPPSGRQRRSRLVTPYSRYNTAGLPPLFANLSGSWRLFGLAKSFWCAALLYCSAALGTLLAPDTLRFADSACAMQATRKKGNLLGASWVFPGCQMPPRCLQMPPDVSQMPPDASLMHSDEIPPS